MVAALAVGLSGCALGTGPSPRQSEAARSATATPAVTPTPESPASTLRGPAATGRVAWTYATGGAIYGGATVSDGAVYFGSDDGYLYSVDLASRVLRWKFETGGLVRSIPSIEAGLAYVASDDRYVYAVRIADGSEAWRADIGDAAVNRVSPDRNDTVWDFHQSSPVAAGGVVYVGSADSHLYALDAQTGATRWAFETPGMVRATPLVTDGTVYFGSWMKGLPWYSTVFALDAATGTEKWSFQGAGDHPTPTLVNGLVYVGGRQAFLYALEAATGAPVWSADFQTSWVESTAAYADGRVFVGSSALGLVQAFDARSGDVRWRFAPSGFPWSSPAVAGGVVYIGSAGVDPDDSVGLWAIDAATGRGLWRVAESGPSRDASTTPLCGFVAGPVVAGGFVYAGALDGRLYAIRIA